MTVVSQINEVGKFFVGMQGTGTGPYTLWVSGGGDNDIKLFALPSAGVLTANGHIVITPVTPATAGYVSNYVKLNSKTYKRQQAQLYEYALKVVNATKPRDNDD